MKKYVVEEKNVGDRLDKFFTIILRNEPGCENIPRSLIARALKGASEVNGKYVKPSYRLKIGDEISLDFELLSKEYQLEKERLALESKIIPQEGVLDIVFENENYFIVNKQPGIVVHPGVGNEKDTLVNYAMHYLKKNNDYDIELKRAGLIHRLDKGVGGLMVFAKNRLTQKFISEQFERHEVLKIYHAEYVPLDKKQSWDLRGKSSVRKVIEMYRESIDINIDDWIEVEGIIRRDYSDRKKMIFHRNSFDKNHRYAKSYLLPYANNRMFVLIKTGRMHQIRATLRSLGLVLKGDTLYGYKGEDSGKISLKSVVLGFKDLDGQVKIFNMLDDFLDD